LKLDNILLDFENGVKICDFGISIIMKKSQVVNEQCGTPAYIAPEVISEEGGYSGFHADIWSAGVLLYAMITGSVPFKAVTMTELHSCIKKGEFTFPTFEHGPQLSEEVKSLIQNLIKVNPLDRFTIPQILVHKWFKDFNSTSDNEEENDP
jgi:serine/threonine protein kinase